MKLMDLRFKSQIETSHAGFSVIEVMIAAGLLSVVVLSMLVLANHMSAASARSNADQVADNVMQQIQGILDQPYVCDNALRDGAGAAIIWNPNGASCTVANVPASVTSCAVVSQIHTRTCPNGSTIGPLGTCIPANAAPTDQLAFQIGPLTSNLSIATMYLRQPMAIAGPMGVNEGAPNVVDIGQRKATTTSAIASYASVNAVLVVRFQMTGNLANSGSYRERTVPVSLAIDKSTNQVTFCANNRTDTAVYSCDPAGGWAGAVNCTGANPDPTRCSATYMVKGFDEAGLPICDCHFVCSPSPYLWQGACTGAGSGGLAATLQSCPFTFPTSPLGRMCLEPFGTQCKYQDPTCGHVSRILGFVQDPIIFTCQ